MKISKTDKRLLEEVRKYLDESAGIKIHIRELVKLSNISEDKLTKGFKSLFGISIWKYQVQLSMKIAMKLLQEGQLIKTISIELGYKSPGNFTRAFQNHYKQTPIQAKNEILQQ